MGVGIGSEKNTLYNSPSFLIWSTAPFIVIIQTYRSKFTNQKLPISSQLSFLREEIEQSESCAWQSTLNLEKKTEKQIRREPSEFKDQFNNAEIFAKRKVGRDFVERTCFVYDWLSGW